MPTRSQLFSQTHTRQQSRVSGYIRTYRLASGAEFFLQDDERGQSWAGLASEFVEIISFLLRKPDLSLARSCFCLLMFCYGEEVKVIKERKQ